MGRRKVRRTNYEGQTKVGSTKVEGRTTAGGSQTLYFVIRLSYFELLYRRRLHQVPETIGLNCGTIEIEREQTGNGWE